MTGQQKLEKRIGDQLDLLNRRLANGKLPIDDYYWGPQKPRSYGVGTPPRPGSPLLSQLLPTPHMIVDVLPLPAGSRHSGLHCKTASYGTRAIQPHPWS